MSKCFLKDSTEHIVLNDKGRESQSLGATTQKHGDPLSQDVFWEEFKSQKTSKTGQESVCVIDHDIRECMTMQGSISNDQNV